MLTLYYKRSFDEQDSSIFGSGWVGAATAKNAGSENEKGLKILEASFNMAPLLSSEQTIDIILPNTIHGCKKKDL